MNEKELQELIARGIAIVEGGGSVEEADSLFVQAGAPFTFTELQAQAERAEQMDAVDDAREAIRQGASIDRVNEVLEEDGFPSFARLDERFRNMDADPNAAAERSGAFLRGAAETLSLTGVDEISGLIGAIGALVPGGRSPGEAFTEDRDRSRGRLDRAQDTNEAATQAGQVGAGVVGGVQAARLLVPLIPAATRGALRLARTKGGGLLKLGGAKEAFDLVSGN